MHKFLTVFLSALVVACVVQVSDNECAWAQADTGAQSADGASRPHLTGTRKQVAIIIFSGLAGGILGLSTLSFYGRPQDHLSNIALGFAVGIITGTIYTTYNAATRPYETFEQENSAEYNPLAQPPSEEEQRAADSPRLPLFAYSWSFQ